MCLLDEMFLVSTVPGPPDSINDFKKIFMESQSLLGGDEEGVPRCKWVGRARWGQGGIN